MSNSLRDHLRLGNPQPSTPSLQAGCASDLALSPEVRPPAEPVPIWAYNIKLSTKSHTHTPLSSWSSPSIQPTYNPFFNPNSYPTNFCPWGRWEGEILLWGMEILWRIWRDEKWGEDWDEEWDEEWEDEEWGDEKWGKCSVKIFELRWVMTLVDYSAMTHHCLDEMN